MEQTSYSLTRNFSTIAQLQYSFNLSYDIMPCGDNCFALMIRRLGTHDRQKSITVSTSADQAQKFLQFLYENAIHPEHLEDFAHDFYDLNVSK